MNKEDRIMVIASSIQLSVSEDIRKEHESMTREALASKRSFRAEESKTQAWCSHAKTPGIYDSSTRTTGVMSITSAGYNTCRIQRKGTRAEGMHLNCTTIMEGSSEVDLTIRPE